MSRSSCPRSLEKKLNREVHYYCPLCGGIPLVRAHTIKTYKDVGWDPNYLLSICGECENNVEKNIIPRTRLHEIKQKLRLTIPQEDRTKPYQINLLNTQTVFIGNNVFYTANIIFSYKRLPILWFSVKDNIRVLNARFYSKD